MSVTIIINPVSGGARPDTARKRAELAAAVVDAHGDRAEVFVTERAGHARDLARAAVVRDVRLVIAWGGDGTINEVASALTFDEVPLGIVPAGSGNGLALELGIDRRPEHAIADALRAEPRPMDVGEIDGRLFVNIAGVGLDAYVAAQFNQPGNTRRGLLSYARITGRALLAYHPARYRLAFGTARSEVRAVLVTIANSPQYGNNARIAPLARLDDGELDLVVVEERSRLRTLVSLPHLFRGTAERVPGCTITRVTHGTIEADLPMTFHVDGETVHGGTRLRVRIHPAALRVAVAPTGR